MLAKNLPMMVEPVVSSGVGSDECIYNIVYTAIEQTQSLRSLVCWFDTIFVVQLRSFFRNTNFILDEIVW